MNITPAVAAAVVRNLRRSSWLALLDGGCES
jgi:hypothetical protein